LLLAMRGIVERINVERQLLRRLVERGDELVVSLRQACKIFGSGAAGGVGTGGNQPAAARVAAVPSSVCR